jgi:hypothetical protein
LEFTEGKNIDRPGFLDKPGPETVVPWAIQGNRFNHGLTDQFNVSNGSISNVMKLFIASGGVMHQFTTKKLQIATPKQDKLLVWLSKRASHSHPVELKTELQTENMVSASATTTSRRLRDADSYACDPAKKYWIQENNPIGHGWTCYPEWPRGPLLLVLVAIFYG